MHENDARRTGGIVEIPDPPFVRLPKQNIIRVKLIPRVGTVIEPTIRELAYYAVNDVAGGILQATIPTLLDVFFLFRDAKKRSLVAGILPDLPLIGSKVRLDSIRFGSV